MVAALLIAAALAASLTEPSSTSQQIAPAPALPAAPQPPPPAAPPQPAPPVSARVFTAPAGVIFNVIKPDKTADFELVVSRLQSALKNNPDPARKKQGAGLKVYKAAEPFQGSVLYVFVIDPAVAGADYTISRILAEMYPSEVQDLYVKFRDSYAAGQTLWNMTPVGPTEQTPKH
jgi:hypothetical protein